MWGKADKVDSKEKWNFRKIEAIEEAAFNKILGNFYKMKVTGLVRENIQNSLDGKLEGCTEPVKVIIKTGTIDSNRIPGIEEVKKHIATLKDENSYTKKTITHMKSCMDIKNVPYISFEDVNTKGLSGAEHGEDICPGDTWGVYAYKKGVHHEESDAERENIRGGSHGVGKIASNAASDLHIMYFANCDEKGQQHIGGTIELIEHELEGQKYRATGYFTDVRDKKYIPFKNDFDEIFAKRTRGLKIIVPYLRHDFNNENEIIQAVCDNFFIAILKGELIVEVNDSIIDKNTISSIVIDEEIYPEQEYDLIKTNFTPLYVKSFLEKEPMEIKILDKRANEYTFDLFFTYDERIRRGRVAMVRGIGMKIEDRKITGYANAAFNAVMIPKESKADMFLKTLENESHTSLSNDHIEDEKIKSNATRFLNGIKNAVTKVIQETIEKENPIEGQIDTSELLYSVTRSFKKDLQSQMSTVSLNRGNKNGNNVVKCEKRKRDKNKGGTNTTPVEPTDTPTKPSKPRRPRVNQETNKARHQVQANNVRRAVIKDKELLTFDFSKDDMYTGENTCDICLKVIDGIGKPVDYTYNIEGIYTKVLDKMSGKYCEVSGETIKDVSVLDGKASLEIKTSEKFNPNFKFMYFVEV